MLEESAYALAELRRVSSKKRYGLAIAQPTSLGQCRLGQPAFSVGNCVPEERLRAAFAECWRVAFDAVADKYGFTEATRAAGWQVFQQTDGTEFLPLGSRAIGS